MIFGKIAEDFFATGLSKLGKRSRIEIPFHESIRKQAAIYRGIRQKQQSSTDFDKTEYPKCEPTANSKDVDEMLEIVGLKDRTNTKSPAIDTPRATRGRYRLLPYALQFKSSTRPLFMHFHHAFPGQGRGRGEAW